MITYQSEHGQGYAGWHIIVLITACFFQEQTDIFVLRSPSFLPILPHLSAFCDCCCVLRTTHIQFLFIVQATLLILNTLLFDPSRILERIWLGAYKLPSKQPIITILHYGERPWPWPQSRPTERRMGAPPSYCLWLCCAPVVTIPPRHTIFQSNSALDSDGELK